MHDDIRPRNRLRPSSLSQTNSPEADVTIPEPTPQSPTTASAADTATVDKDKIEAMLGPSPGLVNDTPTTSRPTAKQYRLFKWYVTKRQLLFYGGLVALVLGSAIASFIILHQPAAKVISEPTPKKAIVVKPTTVANSLTGLQVDPSVNARPVIGVMIENSLDARPQAGLKDAGVVFEAIAEGGITRFLALFQDTQPDYIGPVRSARPYYEQWALGFDAGYAHVGGSPEALKNIKAWGVRDLDQFYNSGAYQRISSRYAPHNVYTSIPKLSQVAASKGYTSSNFTGFARKPEAASKVPNATSIDLSFSGAYYNVHYDYDAASNSYKRSEGGAPHLDDKSGTQLTPKVVVALVMPYSLEADGYHSAYQTLGSGSMFVFQDGVVTPGTWTKTSNNTQFNFTDINGHELALNPGQTWVSVLSGSNKVSYK